VPPSGIDDSGVPLTPPERPAGPTEIAPGAVTLEVARPGGLMHWFPDSADDTSRVVVVMMGNPRIHRPAFTQDGQRADALTIRATTIVAWVDRRGFPELETLGGLEPESTDRVELGPSASVVPEFILGIYAEGAVQLDYGDASFRSDVLYLDPRAYKALLVEPRVDFRALGVNKSLRPVPLHIRARRARLIAKGHMLFDDAEVAVSRADDRIALQWKELSVEEYEEGVTEDGEERPHLLGFQSASSQWFSGRSITVRGERVPLFWLPATEFATTDEFDELRQPVKRLRTGRQARLGRFAFLRLGWPLGPRRKPLVNAYVEGGGYLKRGAAGGVDLNWRHVRKDDRVRGFGSIESWFVDDNRTFDSDGFVHGQDFRYRVVSEARTWLRDDLLFDAEFNAFSDRGFNNEFFERDDLNHKDRESYGRLRYQPRRPGNLVVALDGRWHQRDFVTETVALPELELWALPVPLLRPRRRGAPAVDLTTATRAGYLGRRFDEALVDPDYEAWRIHTDTRANVAMDVGDLRLSGYAGGAATSYLDRTDPGEDLTRTALLAGARVNMQLHRVYAASGGWLQLDGLRHVVDVDAEYAGRFWDSHDVADVPFFDELVEERERSAAILRLRNRLETRRRPPAGAGAGSGSGVRTVADLEVAVKHFLDDVGPYGRDTSGVVELSLYGQPRADLEVAGDAEWDWDEGWQTGSLGAGVRTTLRDRPLTLFGGMRFARGRSNSLTADVGWRFSEKYALRLLETFDWQEGENLTRIVLRRYSPDHIIAFGVSVRNYDEVNLEFSIEPAIGGRTTEGPQAFKDEPDRNPWGAFLR
jgi:hypothetical protein